MEEANVQNSYEQNEQSQNEIYETEESRTEQADTHEGESQESDEVSRETEGEEEESQESEVDRLKREIEELKYQQFQHQNEIQQSYGQPQEQKPERELTYIDVVKDAMNQIRQEEYETQARINQQKLDNEFKYKISEFSRKVKDFDSVVRKIDCINPVMLEMIKASDNPGAFSYHAAKSHENELRRISTLSNPQHQVREMVRLEEKIMASLRPKTVTRTPSPLGDTSGTAGLANDEISGKSTEDLARMLRERAKKR